MMGAQLLDGRRLAAEMKDELRADAARVTALVGHVPEIAVVQMGHDPAADRYVRAIHRTFEEVHLGFRLCGLPADAPGSALKATIEDLNGDTLVNGIIVQMPLPPHIPAALVPLTLVPEKDVDGIHPINAGRLLEGAEHCLPPACPRGGLELLLRSGVPIAGQRAVVVGRSNVVGKPMAMLLLHQHATVTIAHSRTRDLGALTREADLLVAAAGRAGLIRGAMVRPGAVVLDFGVNFVDGRLVGDTVFEEMVEVAAAVSPVPGGTGPMTNVMLVRNTLLATRWAHGLS